MGLCCYISPALYRLLLQLSEIIFSHNLGCRLATGPKTEKCYLAQYILMVAGKLDISKNKD